MEFDEGQATTVANTIVSGLTAYGIDRVFCVAGESFLALLDALHDSTIDVVTCRHEGSASFMAVADAKLTGRASVCIVNRGPGASNACIALHSARQDATPFVLIVGDVRTTDRGRQAFQEMNYVQAFSDLAKGIWVLDDPTRTAETVARAIHVAESGTPGPTVLVLPEDVLEKQVVHGPSSSQNVERWQGFSAVPAPSTMRQVEQVLARAQRPLLIAGGRMASWEGRSLLREVAECHELPVAVSNKHQDLFDNRHPNYAGHLTIATQEQQRRLLAQADLILAVGTRLDYTTTQRYTLPASPVPTQALIHVYPDANQIGFIHQPNYGLACSPIEFLHLLCNSAVGNGAPQRRNWIDRLHTFESRQATWQSQTAPDGVVLGSVVAALNDLAPDDSIVTVDAGNFTSWVHRYFRFSAASSLLGIASSAMGFGVPAGVAAALRHPDRQVVTFVGDGGFLMNGNELATAVQYSARQIIIIANNNSYGTIRQHQERAFPGRVTATDLSNPDFASLARAYGAVGLTIGTQDEVIPTLKQALTHHGPVVVEVKTSLAWISAYSYLPELRAWPPSVGN